MFALLFLNRMSAKRKNNEKKRKLLTNEETDGNDSYCRTCLSTKDLVALFYSKETELKRTEELRRATGLVIKMNDGLSQKICTRCIEILNTSLQFRRTCRKSEKTLINMSLGLKPEKIKNRVGKRRKVEKVEPVEDFGYDFDYEDDFNNDYTKSEDVKPKIRQMLKRTVKRKLAIPNAPLYKCATCSKEFRMKATYKAHMRFHTNYCVCESCGKRCRNNNQLQEHKRARHGLGRIHKCAYCEYSSATKEALIIHERRHTGERPYICDHCGASFHRRANLVQHIAIHLPDKNFQCDMCPKRLKSRKFLQIHKHNAHTGRRYGYLCGVCGHRFEKPNKVRAHTRRVHGLPDHAQPPVERVQL